jgi:DNA polymerase III delta prime subunit
MLSNGTHNKHDIKNLLWTVKYAPKAYNELFSTQQILNVVTQFINSFYGVNSDSTSNTGTNSLIHTGTNRGVLLIQGEHGTGKTMIVNLILEKLGYTPINLNSNDTRTWATYMECIKKAQLKNTIDSTLCGGETKKFVLVNDDMDTLANNEKKDTTILCKLNETNRYFPIIMITSLAHKKFVSDIKKTYKLICDIKPASHDEILKLINRIQLNESINIEPSAIQAIICYCSGDLNRLLHTLQDIKAVFGSNKLTLDEWKEYTETSQRKDTYIDLRKASYKLLNEPVSYDKSIKLYESEKVLVPLMVQENYFRSINSKYEERTAADKMEYNKLRLLKMAQVTDNISLGDIVETRIYTDQNWFLQHIHGFYTCTMTNKLITDDERITRNDAYYNAEFPTDLNVFSLMKINHKNFLNIQDKLPHKTINDLSQIINTLIKKDDMDKIGMYMKTYKLDLKNLNSLLKINKTNDNEILTSKQKRKLTQFIV